MAVAQAVIEEVALPRDASRTGEEFLPVRNDGFQTGFGWKGDEGMQMIRHEQQQLAMPDKVLMIPGARGKYGLAYFRATKMVLVAGFAIDGDEEQTAFRDPLWDLMWQAVADGESHRGKIMGF